MIPGKRLAGAPATSSLRQSDYQLHCQFYSERRRRPAPRKHYTVLPEQEEGKSNNAQELVRKGIRRKAFFRSERENTRISYCPNVQRNFLFGLCLVWSFVEGVGDCDGWKKSGMISIP